MRSVSPPFTVTPARHGASGAYVLTAHGEHEPLEVEDVEVDGARLIGEVEASWTLEVGIRAGSQDEAEALAEEVMAEAQWHYGQWHEWRVTPVDRPSGGTP
jgi:hypothetical protein